VSHDGSSAIQRYWIWVRSEGSWVNNRGNNLCSRLWWLTLVLIPIAMVEMQLPAGLDPSLVENSSNGGTRVVVSLPLSIACCYWPEHCHQGQWLLLGWFYLIGGHPWGYPSGKANVWSWVGCRGDAQPATQASNFVSKDIHFNKDFMGSEPLDL